MTQPEQLRELVIYVHDLARDTQDPVIARKLRVIADALAVIAEELKSKQP